MFPPFTYVPKPPEPEEQPTRRYFIMVTTTLPAGVSFTAVESQQSLLTQFALGFLSVQQVADHLGRSPTPDATDQ